MAKADDSSQDECPLVAVDRRLEDAHRLWHQAEKSYFEPDAFRVAAQNAIQTLRTVTFILQNHKRQIPDFDRWYEPWQQHMGSDALMRWLVEARNKIEKQGDLEARSFVRAEIIASYLEDGPVIEVPAKLFENLDSLLLRIPKDTRGKFIIEKGTLRVQRRWVENSLPDHELLDVIAHGYGVLSNVVSDAHRRMGLPPPQIAHEGKVGNYDKAAMGGRLPCMVGHSDPRSLLVSLSDGSVLTLSQERIPYDEPAAKAAAEKYELSLGQFARAAFADERELATAWFDIARRVFLKDGYHVPFIYLLRDRKMIDLKTWAPENQQQKYLLMRSFAHDAVRMGADGIMLLGEAWIAKADDLTKFQLPSESETKGEVLLLQVATKAGDPFQLMAEIHREGDEVSLGETRTLDGPLFIFAPIYQAWGKPLPPEWLATLEKLRSKQKD